MRVPSFTAESSLSQNNITVGRKRSTTISGLIMPQGKVATDFYWETVGDTQCLTISWRDDDKKVSGKTETGICL